MHIELLVGSAAALMSTVSFVPQAIKVIRLKQTQDISLWMYVLTVCGFALWTSYGLMTTQWALIASNTICLFLSGFILAAKLLPAVARPFAKQPPPTSSIGKSADE
ncbi:MtN3 and saliva related transmembrane protein [Rhizomicrobium palustre]|uniref:MtN3 and saliva related transmembrane protein n=1 Tax=Rhizomicrobium palustre TaxID=189966 RepID=A0A846MVA6_9PROT|nr:SemiSWEET transporter [Rhizomicrobium palustre]NIK87159.1 MtN3 and saliva related transmembrane protein [Rhizomicrobium palustre]